MGESINVEVTPDRMLAVISFSEASLEGQQLSLEEIKQCIQAKGIIYGVDESVLSELAVSRNPDFKYIIARGLVPTKGQDAIHQFYFDEENLDKIKPKEKSDGTVDFKDLNIVHNVAKGQILYKKIPARTGNAGRNVLGQEIPAPMGKDIRLPKGQGVELLEDGTTLVAGIEGRLCYDAYNIYIAPLLNIEKDVDSSTGNIDFVGNVIINGSVKNGFKVKAKGNIEIHGSVEAAFIEADGDVLIWYGFQGMDKGSIKAKGNITIKFIQNARVEAGGDVTAEAVMHSQVAANNIYVDKGKGLIVGGKLVAGHLISACTLGSSMATQTDLHIGIPIHIMNEYKEVEKIYLTATEEIEKVSQDINFLMTRRARGELSPDKVEVLRKLLVTRVEWSDKKNNAFDRYMALKVVVQNAILGNIKVKYTLYPGVRITIGNMIKYIKEEYTHCCVQKDNVDIVIGLY